MSRIVCASSTWTRSTAPIVPPASPIALATLPSIPGTWSISTRSVRLYWALGVVGHAAPDLMPRGDGVRRTAADRDPAQIASDDDARRALPDRRQQPRLPRVLRAAGVDRDLDRRARPTRSSGSPRCSSRSSPTTARRRPSSSGTRATSGRKEVYSEYKAQRSSAARSAQGAVAAPRAAGRGVRLPQPPRRRLRGRRRDRLDRRAAPRRQDPPIAGDGRDRRPRRLPAGRRQRPDHDHLAAGSPTRSVYDRAGRDRPLRDPARAGPRLHRPQGRHQRQHPRRSRDRRQDRRRAAAAVRLAGGRCSTASTRSPAPSASRT